MQQGAESLRRTATLSAIFWIQCESPSMEMMRITLAVTTASYVLPPEPVSKNTRLLTRYLRNNASSEDSMNGTIGVATSRPVKTQSRSAQSRPGTEDTRATRVHASSSSRSGRRSGARRTAVIAKVGKKERDHARDKAAARVYMRGARGGAQPVRSICTEERAAQERSWMQSWLCTPEAHETATVLVGQ